MLYHKADKVSKIIPKMESIDFPLLTKVLPLWCSELRDLGNSLPMQKGLFDLVIVDEASQVNISEIIPAFYRGRRYCVVGDKNQLNLNATGVGFAISKAFDKLTWQGVMSKHKSVIKYEDAKRDNLIITESSILDFVSSPIRDFSVPKTELDEHYRSLPQLATFTSKTFYDNKWKIMTENGKNNNKKCFKNIKVEGQRDPAIKLVMGEIEKVKEMISDFSNDKFDNYPELKELGFSIINKPSIWNLSFLTLQVNKIRELLDENFSEEELKGFNLFVATPEEFQGNERDVMLITLGLDNYCNWGKGFYENYNRFNVATSRAKYFTYLIYAGIPKTANLIKKYLLHFGIKVEPEDEIEITDQDYYTSNKSVWEFDYDKCDSDFEKYVYEYLKRYIKERLNLEIYNQVNACGQKRLDFVLYNQNNQITCAIEVDGKDHFMEGTMKYTEAHLERIEILNRAGWKIVHVKYYNWYNNGWLCEDSNLYFQEEIKRLYSELDSILL